MAGVLTFEQYLGGADQLQMISSLPSNQKIKNYNFQEDITDWEFTADYRVIVVDTITVNRHTGAPNFADSIVIGSFPEVVLTGALVPEVIDVNTGSVNVVIPADMYTGALYPNARKNVPIAILTFTWSNGATVEQINTHRWAIIQTYGSSVTPGDPTLEADYVALT